MKDSNNTCTQIKMLLLCHVQAHMQTRTHTLHLNKVCTKSLWWRVKAKQPWLLILNKFCRKALYLQKKGLNKSLKQPRPQKQIEWNFLHTHTVCSQSTTQTFSAVLYTTMHSFEDNRHESCHFQGVTTVGNLSSCSHCIIDIKYKV